jgi:hypothetical protein
MAVPWDKKTEIAPGDWLRRFSPAYARWSRPREVADKEITKDILAMEDQKARPRQNGDRACG